MEPTVKMGHASAAIERRAEREPIASCKELHAVCPRGQMNEPIQKAGLGVYLERRLEWLHEMGDLLRKRAELAVQSMARLVQGEARTMRAGLQTNTGDGFAAVPGLDHSLRQKQVPGIELDQPGQGQRDRQRERER